MQNIALYLVVALGTFMSYIFTPTLDQTEARVVFRRLFYGQKKQRRMEWLLLWVAVFGGGALAFFVVEPNTPRLAVTAGLGWTSVFSAMRGAVPNLNNADQPDASSGKDAIASGQETKPTNPK